MKPILFNTDMVRAILDGRKTVTRRVVKPQPRYSLAKMPLGSHKGEWHEYNENSLKDPAITSPWGYQYTPPYRPGDILYVRETWAKVSSAPLKYAYKADNNYLVSKWRPSIHMPREAARIFLRVTDVRVERLWDTTEEGARREGLYRGWKSTENSAPALTAKQGFMWVWDSTVKPADRSLCGWIANPWVWVIEFERISREEAVNHAVL